MSLYCPNCGCTLFGKECEFCGPESSYEENPKFCKDCGGRKTAEGEETGEALKGEKGEK